MRQRLTAYAWQLAVRFERPLRWLRRMLWVLLIGLSRAVRSLPGTSRRLGPPRRLTWSTHDWAAGKGLDVRTLSNGYRFDRQLVEADGQTVPHHFHDSCDWRMPPTFVVPIPAGRVWGSDGLIVATDDTLLADQTNVFVMKPEALPLMRAPRLGTPRVLPGVTATITAAMSDSYYHWMLDLLPRLDLLQRAGIAYDRLIAPDALPFQRETLRAAGVSPEALVRPDDEFYVECETLLFPSVPGTAGQSPVWSLAYLRDLFAAERNGQEQTRRLYLSRADTNRRRLANEDEVFAALEGSGFELVTGSGMTVAEQARLFAQAEVVVAPHGGALTNLVFCEPGTKVVEFFPPGYNPVCFWTICAGLDLPYRPIFDEDWQPFDGTAQWQPYEVNPKRVLAMLASLGVSL